LSGAPVTLALERVIDAIRMIYMINHKTASLAKSSPCDGVIRISFHFDNLALFYFQKETATGMT
jgi:hypothetical protein